MPTLPRQEVRTGGNDIIHEAQHPPVRDVPRVKRRATSPPPDERAVGNGRWYKNKSAKDSNLGDATMLAQECASYTITPFCTIYEFPDQILEIEFPFIEGEREIRKYLKNPEAFNVSSLKKKRVEVREKNLTRAEKELIAAAKGKEVREFIKENAEQKGEKVVEEKTVGGAPVPTTAEGLRAARLARLSK